MEIFGFEGLDLKASFVLERLVGKKKKYFWLREKRKRKYSRELFFFCLPCSWLYDAIYALCIFCVTSFVRLVSDALLATVCAGS